MTWKAIAAIAGRMRWTGSAVAGLSRQGIGFDSRSIASALGVSVDEVNVALTDLCVFGVFELKGK